jgi:Zinc finger protein
MYVSFSASQTMELNSLLLSVPDVLKKCKEITNCPTLREEFHQLIKIHQAISSFGVIISAPKPVQFFKSDYADFWSEFEGYFPLDDQSRTSVFSMSRVYPLPVRYRVKIVQLFCPPLLKDLCHSEAKNHAHVAQILLGRTLDTSQHTTPQRFFSTYNYPLTCDSAEKLGMDTGKIAQQMGSLLAALHMGASSDAKDIEIVLGGDYDRGLIRNPKVWVLDFNQCSTITLDHHCIPQLVDAFFENEAYFPRPREGDPLFASFASGYIVTSSENAPKLLFLANLFIEGIKVEQAKKDKLRK